MTQQASTSRRRFTLHAGLAATAGVLLPHGAMATPREQAARSCVGERAALSRTDETALRADDTALPQRARDLIRIGENGIARDNPKALEDFFHPAFRFHGPGGAELDRQQLWAYFAACRSAFDDFTVTRQTLVSDGADHLAARTRFAGTFARPFSGSPAGTIAPNGKPFEYRLINIFRYAPDGRLIEEWVQYDVQGFYAQLRA